MALSAGALLMAAPGAHAAEVKSHWTIRLNDRFTPKQLHLPAKASPAQLARAAVKAEAGKLVGGRQHLGGLKVAESARIASGGKVGHIVRLRQTLDGRRVVWSILNVLVNDHGVTGVSGTSVPLKSMRVAGRPRVDAKKATQIALGTLPGSTLSRAAQRTVYAGSPDNSRAPRRAWVVELSGAAVAEVNADEAPTTAVVVDSANGKVLQTWRGTSSHIGGGRGAVGARAAVARTAVIQVADSQGTPNIGGIGVNLASTTTGPLFSNLLQQPFGSPSTTFLNSNAASPLGVIAQVTRRLCQVRFYCGRTGNPFVFSRWFFNVNFKGCRLEGSSEICDTSHYSPSNDRVFFIPGDEVDPYTVAHETGHVIDTHRKNDEDDTLESSEVREALAEMFSYDHSFKTHFSGVTSVPIEQRLRAPSTVRIGGISLPEQMSQYRCDLEDTHINGYILGHAYYQWIEHMTERGVANARDVASDFLYGLPSNLAARRSFGDVRSAFNQVIKLFYSTSTPVFQAFNQAFGTDTHILFTDSRADRGCSEI